MKKYIIECDSIETAYFYTRAELKKLFTHAVPVTADEGLVGELTQVLEDWEINGNPMQKLELEAILSKYRPVPVVKEQGEAGLDGIVDYDAGLLSNYGGGNVSWWQDYLRHELMACNEHWRAAIQLIHPSPVASGLVEEMTIYNNTVIRNVDSEMWRQVDSILSRYSKEAK